METWNEAALRLESGRLCLEFGNTANWHASPQPEEELTSYSEFIAWATRAGVLSQAEAEALLQKAEHEPANAERTLAQAIDLREAIYRLFSAIAHGNPGSTEDIEAVNRAWQHAARQMRLRRGTTRFDWAWSSQLELDRPVWPVALSAGDLLTSDQLDRVGECADDRGCGWLFFDSSRNRSRRWCGMDSCGNRAKAKRHYERKRGAAAPA